MTEWHGTADAPLPDPHARMPGFPSMVTLPAAEAALLTRIAEMADEYSRLRLWEIRKELLRLLKQWRKEWKHKPHTS